MASSSRSPILFLKAALLKIKPVREVLALSGISIDARRDIEKSILSRMTKLNESGLSSLWVSDPELKTLCEELTDEPFGFCSLQFIDTIKDQPLPLDNIWRLIETYLVHTMHDVAAASDDLAKLESELRKKMPIMTLEERRRLFNPDFIICVYGPDNEALIKLFMNLLPIPTSTAFSGRVLPRFMLEQEKTNTQHILHFLNGKTVGSVESDVLKIQRQIRAHRRYKEEAERIPRLHSSWIDPDKDIKAVMQEANTRYFPRCQDKYLAYRIFAASAQVNLFSTLKHLTSKKALKSILDDALYGRETLEFLYMAYNPAALGNVDVLNGDLNAICFGPNQIDPRSKQKEGSVEIVFDFERMDPHNSGIFYKQKDFGYNDDIDKKIKIGTEELIFLYSSNKRVNTLSIYFSNCEVSAQLPNYLFIAYDVEHIHQILTLNFFRFLDTMIAQGGEKAEIAEKVYSQIATLTDDELVEFLTKLGKGMTQTTEFNFYGAHKIDIATIISFEHEEYKLTMKDFIQQLEAGNIEALRTAQKNISPLFSSYRFIDYLLSTISNKTVKAELQQLRKPCVTPFWLEMKEKSISADYVGAYQNYCQLRAKVKHITKM